MKFLEIQWQSDWYRQEITLRDRLLRMPLGLSFTPQELASEQDQLHFGVTVDDRLIAALVVVPLQHTHVKIRQMCVDVDQQRRGVGSWLMAQTEAAMIEKGIQSIELNARDIAIGFYQRLGYEKVGEEFIEVSIAHHKMVKQIDRGKG